MATLTEWPLPANPPNPYTGYLSNLTPESGGKLYYTKSILDVVGELNLGKQTRNVREWVFPPGLRAPSYQGIAGNMAYGPHGRPWFVLRSAPVLVELEPAGGLFTAYRAVSAGSDVFDFRGLRFDAEGKAWFRAQWIDPQGSDSGTAVGVLRSDRRVFTVWQLPIGIGSSAELWLEPDGAVIWSSTQLRFRTPEFTLFRLNTASGRLTYWRQGLHTVPTGNGSGGELGVVGEPGRGGQGAENVWFAYTSIWLPQPRLARLNVRSGTFYDYAAAVPIAPQALALDADANVWVGHNLARVSMIARDADCGSMNFGAKSVKVEPIQFGVSAREMRVRARTVTAKPVQAPAPDSRDSCFTHYDITAGSPFASSTDIAPDEPAVSSPAVAYFTEPSVNKIGRLEL